MEKEKQEKTYKWPKILTHALFGVDISLILSQRLEAVFKTLPGVLKLQNYSLIDVRLYLKLRQQCQNCQK